MFKNFDVVVDTTQKSRHNSIVINTNDLKTAKLSITINQATKPIDLTDATVRIAIVKPDKKTVFKDCTVTDPAKGKCEIILDTQAYIINGVHYAEVMIYFAADTVAVTGKFAYSVESGILNDKTLESTNDLQVLHQATFDAEEATTSANDAADNANTKAELAQEKADLAQFVADSIKTNWLTPVSTFADIATTYPNPVHGDQVQVIADGENTGKVYRYENGIWDYKQNNDLAIGNVQIKISDHDEQLADTGWETANGLTKKIVDQTAELNTYFNVLSAKGIRYAKFNKNVEYLATGDLTNAYKVIKTGNGKINKKNPNNWFTHISKSLASFNGKINSNGLRSESPVGTGSFKQFLKALSKKRPIKVCYFGDSISTSGISSIDFSTRMVKATTNGTKNAPDGIVEDASYPFEFMNMLTDTFPNVTFKYNNFAVAGSRIDEWDKPSTYLDSYMGTTKAKRIDYVKDVTPDLLVVGYGMNHADFDTAKTFANDLKNLIDYVNVNFSPVPDIVVVTAPRPIYIPGEADYGAFERQASRMIAANSARAIAKEYGAYVCDVARVSDIKRIGLDYSKPIAKKMNLSDFTKDLTNVVDNGDGSFTFSAGSIGKLLLTGNYLKDFNIKFTVNFGTLTSNDSNYLVFNFNKTRFSNFYENRAIIYPKRTDNFGRIDTLTRVVDSSSWVDYTTGKFFDTESYENKDVTFMISKKGEKVEVRKVVGGVEHICIIDYADTWDTAGWFDFTYDATSLTNVLTIKNIEITGADYPEFMPAITEDELWGGYVAGDISVKLPYGGNGVNHPSSIGITECYVPPLKEMANDILNEVNMSNAIINLYTFPVTETKTPSVASAAFSYINVNTQILSARVVSPTGVVYKLNKSITGYYGPEDKAIGGTLGANEFGMYIVSDTQAQILINQPSSAGWVVTTYQSV